MDLCVPVFWAQQTAIHEVSQSAIDKLQNVTHSLKSQFKGSESNQLGFGGGLRCFQLGLGSRYKVLQLGSRALWVIGWALRRSESQSGVLRVEIQVLLGSRGPALHDGLWSGSHKKLPSRV